MLAFRSRLVLVLLCLLVSPPLRAEQAGCGSVVIPTGVGLGPPAGVNSLNPLLTSSSYAHEVIDQFLRPLVWIDRHGEPDFSRSVAASVATPDDGSTFVITLHDWRWSDGVPITAGRPAVHPAADPQHGAALRVVRPGRGADADRLQPDAVRASG